MRDFIKKRFARYRFTIWLSVGLLVLYTVVGFFIAPKIVQHAIRDRVSGLLQRTVSAERVRVNPYTFSVTIQGLAIAEKDGKPFVGVQRLYANAQLSSLFRRALVLKTMELNGPTVRVVRQGPEQFNFSDWRTLTSSPEADPPPKPMRVVLSRLTMTGGRIDFEDQAADGRFMTQWRDIQFLLKGLDTQPGAEPAQFHISTVSETQEKVTVNGQATAAPLSVRADIQLDALSIAKYAPYYKPFFRGHVAAGTVTLKASALWADGTGRVDPIGMQISKLHIDQDQERQILTIDRLAVAEAAVDLKDRTIHLGRITTQDGKVWVSRDDQGRINLLNAVVLPDEADQAQPMTTEKKTWQIVMAHFSLDNYSLSVTDLQPTQPARIDINQISATAEGLSNQKDTAGKVAVKFFWSDQGTFTAEGPLTLQPLATELKIDASGLDLRPTQPYISEHLQLTVTSGKLDTKGILRIAPNPGQGPDIQYAGQVALNDFQSVDNVKTSDFITWKSLFLSGLEVGTSPLRLAIDEVSLTDFFKRLIVNADGTTNLGTIFKRVADAAADAKAPQIAAAEPDLPANIRINTVILQGGRVDFSDQLVQPNVRAALSQLGGRISGLASIKEEKADVLLRGTTPSKIPFEIKGKVNPLVEPPFADLTIVFKGIELSQFTPYAGKYLGYELDKGQLSLTLGYLLENGHLAGQNKVEVNQLTLGEPVRSPDATKLPIKLAIALLKDAKGNINLDLPIEGTVDDPEFSIGGIVVTMLGNLIVDIVRSPFKMLGAMFGGGEALQYLKFDVGNADIRPAGAEKLAILAKALAERPGLNLDIQGQIDPAADRDALRQMQFDRQLKSAKLKSLWRAMPLDQIVVSPEEKARLIKKAYKDATFPKPRDEKGNLKVLEPAEMEKLLITAIEVGSDVLRQLAFERAANAKNHLVEQGGIAADRLFVVDPDIAADAAAETPQSRVQFKVK